MKRLNVLNINLSKKYVEEISVLLDRNNYIYRISTLSSTENLYEEVLSGDYHLTFLEYQSNLEKTVEWIHLIKKASPDIPIFVISPKLSDDLIVKCMKTGADDFIYSKNLFRILELIDNISEKTTTEKQNINGISLSSLNKVSSSLVYEFNDAIFMVDEDNKIILWNKAASKIFGYSTEEIENHPVNAILTETGLERFLEYCETKQTNSSWIEKQGIILNLEGLKKSGAAFPASFSISKHISDTGSGILCVVRDETERRHIERELKESRDEFREILENIQDVFYRTDKEGNLVFVNKSAVGVMGYDSISEIIGLNLANDVYCTPEDRRVFLRELEKKGRVDNYEVKIKDKQGEVLTVLASSHFYYDSEGNNLGVEGVFSDITARKKVENELGKKIEIEKAVGKISSLFISTQDYYEALTEFLKFFLNITNASFSALFIIVDRLQELQCSRIISRDSDKSIDNSFFPKEYDLNLFPTILRQLAEKRPIDNFAYMGENSQISDELKSLGMSKESKFYMLFPLVSGNTVRGFIALFSDHDFEITILENYQTINLLLEILANAHQKKKSEERASRLSKAVEQAEETIVITDVNGNIQYVNPSFEKVTGYTLNEVIGSNPRLLKSGKHDNDFYKTLWETISNGNTWKGRLTNRKKSGQFFEEEASISPVRDEKGQIINYVSVKRDITEMAMLEAQLRQAQKLESIGQLAAGIAHEINTPIQYVGDNLYFLKDSIDSLMDIILDFRKMIDQNKGDYSSIKGTLSDTLGKLDYDFLKEEIPEAINHSIDGTKRVSRIVNAMKEFSHPGSIEKNPVDINKAIESTITVSRNEWKYIADLTTDFDDNLPFVPCLQADFNQAVLNLIINAAHAIEEKSIHNKTGNGTIKISTKGKENKVIIKIEDSGQGIDNKIIDRIYDPFFTTKEVGKGTGQGLSIVHNVIVEKHEGKIFVESEKGKGTIFTIELPL